MDSRPRPTRENVDHRGSSRTRWTIGLLLGALFFMMGRGRGSAGTIDFGPEEILALENIREPSGLAWDQRSQTLLVASDSGALTRIDSDGHVLQRREFPEDDLEAVCLDPRTGNILLLSERKANVIELDGSTLAPLRTTHLRRLPRCPRRNAGFEGLCRLDDPSAICVIKEKEPAALILLEHERPVRTILLDAPSASGVLFLKRSQEFVVVSRELGLRLLSQSGRPLGPWKAVGATRVESIAVVPGRGLYLARDTRAGTLLVSRAIDSEEKLREALLP